MKILRASPWLACLLMVVTGRNVAAAETLTLGTALERAISANPLLAAHAAAAESARARAERESLAPPLMLGAEIENVGGNDGLRGFDAAESTLQVSRTLELGGKRAGRRALGQAEIALAGHAITVARLDLQRVTTQRFVEVVADQERLALAVERVAQAARTREEVARVVQHARNPETDLRAAEIALADAELERDLAAHELRAARVTLASTWGARQPDFERASLALDALSAPPSFETLAASLSNSAAARALGLETDSAAARVRLAEAQARPDLNLSLGVRRLEAFDDHGLVMGVVMPLGTGSRARLARAEARAETTAIERRREALDLENYQQLFQQYQELDQARGEFQALDESMIPKAQQALQLATRGFELGRFPFTTLSQAQETLFQLQRRRIDAAARYHVLSAGMQRLIAAAPEAP